LELRRSSEPLGADVAELNGRGERVRSALAGSERAVPRALQLVHTRDPTLDVDQSALVPADAVLLATSWSGRAASVCSPASLAH
jgi:hypothetical protein